MTKAIILFSGGLDSTVMLAMALDQGRDCYALSFDYGQRHRVELEAAKSITKHYNVPHHIITIDPSAFAGSSLVSDCAVPTNRTTTEIAESGVPNTYVPARNTLFLSYALGQAEIHAAEEIYFGANALDNLPYPDCRPEFVTAYQALINVSTKQAIEGSPPTLVAPLIHWNKTEIIRKGQALNTPLHLTLSCYQPFPFNEPCQVCDACKLREEAFTAL